MKLRKLFLAVIAGAALLTACDKKEVDLGPAKLTVNPADVAFGEAGSSQEISLVATRDWAVTGVPDWLALSQESGAANSETQKISLSVSANSGYNRSAKITFSIGFDRTTITVSQEGAEGEMDNGDGTKEKPFTVAGAIAYVKELGADVESPNKVYVKGFISEVETTYEASGTHGNANFFIVDEEGATERFYVFQTMYLGNEKWTKSDSNPDVKQGDEVIVFGPIYNYKGNTPETVSKGASFVYMLNGVSRGGDEGGSGEGGEGEPKGTGTLEDPFNPAGAAAAVANLTWTDNTTYDQTEPVYIKGKISKISSTYEASGTHGNANFTIVDETDGTGSFEVFQTLYLGNKKWESGQTDIKVDDIVIVFGPIMNYKGNTPETVGKGASYVYSLNGETGGGTEPVPDPDPEATAYILDGDAIKAAHTEAWNYSSGEKIVTATDYSKWTLFNTFCSTAQVTVQMNKGKSAYVLSPLAPEGKEIKKVSVVLNKSADGTGEMGDRVMDILNADGTKTLLDDVTGQALADGMELPAGNTQVRIICDEAKGGAVYITSISIIFAEGGEGGDTPGPDDPDQPKLPVNDGSEANPFTVEDAVYVARNSEEAKEYYVKAVVGKDISIKNGVATFELKDGTTAEVLTVVKAKSFKGADFDGTEPLEWLDEVILKGKVTEYRTLPALTEASFVKWNGKPTFSNAETDLSKVIALPDNTEAYFSAVVSGVSTNSFVVTDGTNNIYVFNPATMAAIGDQVTIKGTKKTYGNVAEIDKGAEVEVEESGKTVTYGTPADITAGFDAYSGAAVEYITFTGTVAKSGNYFNVNVEGATAHVGTISSPVESLGLDALDGKKVVLTGYFIGLTSKDKYINLLCTKAEEYKEVLPANYVKVTTAPSDWSGKYLLVTETANKAFSGFSGTLGTGADVTIADGKIVSGATVDACQLVIAKASVTEGAYTISFGDKLLKWVSGNTLTSDTTESANTNWKLSIATVSSKTCVYIENAADATRKLKWNNSSPRFCCYTSAQTEVQLYKLEE